MLIASAQEHLKRTRCVNFQGVFSDLVQSARMQKSQLLSETIL